MAKRWCTIGAAVAIIGTGRELSTHYGLDKDALLKVFAELSDRLGVWAIPLYVAIHTLTLALCLPYAVFFEVAASMLFGFFLAILCVFAAKLLSASLSFWIGRSPILPLAYSNHTLWSFLKTKQRHVEVVGGTIGKTVGRSHFVPKIVHVDSALYGTTRANYIDDVKRTRFLSSLSCGSKGQFKALALGI